jgi:hypothetical protein
MRIKKLEKLSRQVLDRIEPNIQFECVVKKSRNKENTYELKFLTTKPITVSCADGKGHSACDFTIKNESAYELLSNLSSIEADFSRKTLGSKLDSKGLGSVLDSLVTMINETGILKIEKVKQSK